MWEGVQGLQANPYPPLPQGFRQVLVIGEQAWLQGIDEEGRDFAVQARAAGVPDRGSLEHHHRIFDRLRERESGNSSNKFLQLGFLIRLVQRPAERSRVDVP